MIGRVEEIEILKEALNSSQAEMVAVVGRRRIGKTYLINYACQKQLSFFLTGTQYSTKEIQLHNFSEKLKEYFSKAKHFTTPISWSEAFQQLSTCLKNQKSTKKKVIFFDELPWLATNRSGFVGALSYFWNDYAATANVMVVICGSAASWMIDYVVNHKGGLHNRITKLIQLEPFTLNETQAYFKSKKMKFDLYELTQLYMVMGGIPHYLNAVKAGESVIQNIGRICFTKTGLLYYEFQNLYAALFDFYDNHVAIIQALATKWKGITRNEIIKLTKFSNGGGLTKILNELESSSFISSYVPFGKVKRETLYRLTDEYSLFYLKFIKNVTSLKASTWLSITKTPSYISWSGYAFETLCLKHIESIKKALGIGAVYTQESSFLVSGNSTIQGTQIDLLIDREDKAITICEMKYTQEPFLITKEYAKKLKLKKTIFKQTTQTKKHLFLAMVTTYGVVDTDNSVGLIDQNITLGNLFQ
jgi:uncharacterized protein